MPAIMSRPESVEATETSVTKAAEKTGKKAEAKANKKAGSKKAATKVQAAKAESANGKKEGLRKPQVRILAALAKHGELSRPSIANKAGVDSAYCTSWIGSTNDAVRAKNDAQYFPSLVTLGFVKPRVVEGDDDSRSEVRYTITASGKKALEKATKAS